jgi:hypothetical protein
MDVPLLTDDFREFLRLLNVQSVDYYEACRARAVEFDIDGLAVPVISLDDLKTNKRAAGRHKDLADLDNLP